MDRLKKYLKKAKKDRTTVMVISSHQREIINFDYNKLTLDAIKVTIGLIVIALTFIYYIQPPAAEEHTELSAIDKANYNKLYAYRKKIMQINDVQERIINKLNIIKDQMELQIDDRGYEQIKSFDLEEYQKLSNNFRHSSHMISAMNNFLKRREMVYQFSPYDAMPLKGRIRVTSGYGKRWNPYRRKWEMHYGIDYGKRRWTNIYATGSGIIRKAFWSSKRSNYGRHVIIEHKFGYETLYAHMVRLNVRYNSFVKKGQIIGRVGATGRASGPHLHYETILDGKNMNPNLFTAP